jgi:hypothetical protein
MTTLRNLPFHFFRTDRFVIVRMKETEIAKRRGTDGAEGKKKATKKAREKGTRKGKAGN